ncbi:hypothetical protein KC318_g5277 [Hortaea werneckii]|nr:hypothetical protein KC334_g5383 [Hortaea werneckii]KAI7027964.1 hypothetical protein KC355_g148 [Hortaea werneckii]KAI7668460.1 hypothetical protein KC318_g5277 [Hortaea werneckii]
MLRGLDGVWDSSAGNDGDDAGGWSVAPEKMTLRVLSLKALELLVRRSRREGDGREFLSEEQLEKVLLDPSDNVRDEQNDDVDLCTAISLLESLSTSALALAWPETLLHRLAALFPLLATAGTEETSTSSSKSSRPPREHRHQQQQREQRHTLFLLYRLTLNLTTDHPRNCSFFATRGTFYALLSSIYASFLALDAPLSPSNSALTTRPKPPQQQQQSPPPTTTTMPTSRALTLDLLILALGIAINLTTDYSSSDYSDDDNGTSTSTLLLPLLIDPADPLSSLFARLIRVFRVGRVRIDRELDSSPPPEKEHPARGERAVSSGEPRGRERGGLPQERIQQGQQRDGGEDEGEGQGQGDDGDGDVGFNIAWGYLAVFLGKCCSFPSSSSSSSHATAGVGGREIRRFVAGCLQDDEEGGGSGWSAVGRQREKTKKEDGTEEETSGAGLEILVQAVEEFVLYHQRVDGMMMNNSGSGGGGHSHSQGFSVAKGDMMDEDGLMMSGGGEKDEEAFAGQEGKEVWSAFTEKLRLVLERLRRVVREDV